MSLLVADHIGIKGLALERDALRDDYIHYV
jgi:hypothetical protein